MLHLARRAAPLANSAWRSATAAQARPSGIRHLSNRYLQSHEFITVEGNIGTVGITDHAQSQLGDVVYVELPEVGDEFEAGDTFGNVESVKAASDVYMPVTGTVSVDAHAVVIHRRASCVRSGLRRMRRCSKAGGGQARCEPTARQRRCSERGCVRSRLPALRCSE